MGKKIAITLGPLSFNSKKEAIAHLNEMLKSYEAGDRVSESDAVVLAAALARHPEASEKIGSGIKDFSVRSAEFGTRCFWVNRTDGSTVKFSHKAI